MGLGGKETLAREKLEVEKRKGVGCVVVCDPFERAV